MSADTKCIGGHYCISSNGSPFFEKYLLLPKSLPIFVPDIFLEFALIWTAEKRPKLSSSKNRAEYSHPRGVGRLCLLDDWVTWSLPQLL